MNFITKDREPSSSEVATVAARLAVVQASFKALEECISPLDRLSEVPEVVVEGSNQPEVTYIEEAPTQPVEAAGNTVVDMASYKARHEARSTEDLWAELKRVS